MDKEKEALALTKALGYVENGGKPDINNLKAGKSGEAKSIFQYTPETWKASAKEILGDENTPLTPQNEALVTTKRVSNWLNQGYTPEQILSMHNAGQGEPDAYSGHFSNGQPSTGKNKYGVHYDVPGYVDKGMKYYNEFLGEEGQSPDSMASADQAPSTESSQQTPITGTPQTGQAPAQSEGTDVANTHQQAIQKLVAMMKQAQGAPQKPAGTKPGLLQPTTKTG